MTTERVRVLIAEDEPHLGAILERYLAGRGYAVTTRSDGRAALEALRAHPFDVALLDVVMPEMDGLEVLRHVRQERPCPEVIIITGNGTTETAINAINMGAYDYLAKPYRMAEIDVLVRRACEKRQLARENEQLRSRLARVDAVPEILTRYAPMQAVLALVERTAASDAPVLISGERGTGRGLVARALHRHSHRSSAPIVELSCTATPEHLLEGELFGVEGPRGTNSERIGGRPGLLELADGGTMLVDDVGRLPIALQERLLEVLERGSFRRPKAGGRTVAADVRLLAVAQADLSRNVAEGTLRGELYYRMSKVHIRLPPLRERATDIPLLAECFARRYGGAEPPTLSDDALHALGMYTWPGNVRELRNVIERAAMVATGGVIRAGDLPFVPLGSRPARPSAGPALVSLQQLERRHIEDVLRAVAWHQGRAAGILGISPKTLYRKIREFGLRRPAANGAGRRAAQGETGDECS